MYTVIQRCIRATVNPDVQFSFDSANPSHATRTFNAFATCRLGNDNWTMQTVNIGGDELIGSKVLLIDYLAETVFEKWRRDGQGAEHIIGTGISRKITLGDVCVSQKNNAAWEGESPQLVMNHNIQAVIEAMRTAYRLFEEDDLLGVPTQMKTMRAIIDEVFSAESPFDLIEQCRPWLDGYNTRIEAAG